MFGFILRIYPLFSQYFFVEFNPKKKETLKRHGCWKRRRLRRQVVRTTQIVVSDVWRSVRVVLVLLQRAVRFSQAAFRQLLHPIRGHYRQHILRLADFEVHLQRSQYPRSEAMGFRHLFWVFRCFAYSSHVLCLSARAHRLVTTIFSV